MSRLKALYRDYLASFGIDAVYPPQLLRAHTDAVKLHSEEVASITREMFAANSNVDAIYFQGALLDPLKVLDRLESELNVPIVASNPAMLGDPFQAWPQLQHSWPWQTTGFLAGVARRHMVRCVALLVSLNQG